MTRDLLKVVGGFGAMGAVALTLAGSVGAHAAGGPATIVSLRYPLYAVAQDGGRLAWAVGPCGAVTIRDLASGRLYGFRSGCEDAELGAEGIPGGFGELALGGTRAVWWTWWHGNSYHQVLATGRWGGRVDPMVEETSSDCEETLLPAIAADGDVAVYSLLTLDGPELDPCGVPVNKAGDVVEVGRGKALDGVPPAVALAVSAPLVAVVPLDPSPRRHAVDAAANGPVGVYDVRTARRTVTVHPAGTAVAVALSRQVLAVLVRTAGTRRIEWFDPHTAAALGSLGVPAATAPRLSAAGTTIVYRAGRRIFALETTAKTSRVVATAAAAPLDVSIEGRRVVWGENRGGRGRIVGLTLAAH